MDPQDRRVLEQINRYISQARTQVPPNSSAARIIGEAFTIAQADRGQRGNRSVEAVAAEHYLTARSQINSGELTSAPLVSESIYLGYSWLIKPAARALDAGVQFFNGEPFYEPQLRVNPNNPTSRPNGLSTRWALIGYDHGRLDKASPNRPVNDLCPW